MPAFWWSSVVGHIGGERKQAGNNVEFEFIKKGIVRRMSIVHTPL